MPIKRLQITILAHTLVLLAALSATGCCSVRTYPSLAAADLTVDTPTAVTVQSHGMALWKGLDSNCFPDACAYTITSGKPSWRAFHGREDEGEFVTTLDLGTVLNIDSIIVTKRPIGTPQVYLVINPGDLPIEQGKQIVLHARHMGIQTEDRAAREAANAEPEHPNDG